MLIWPRRDSPGKIFQWARCLKKYIYYLNNLKIGEGLIIHCYKSGEEGSDECLKHCRRLFNWPPGRWMDTSSAPVCFLSIFDIFQWFLRSLILTIYFFVPWLRYISSPMLHLFQTFAPKCSVQNSPNLLNFCSWWVYLKAFINIFSRFVDKCSRAFFFFFFC